MKRFKKEDISQEVFDLYDDYAHNRLERREFIEKLSKYAVGGLTLSSLMGFIMPDYNKQQVSQDDPRIKSRNITYPSPKGAGEMKGLLSMPIDTNVPLGGVVVVHENRGLNPYIKDVGRRVALAGFVSLAPDALTPLGGYPGTDDEGRELQHKRDKDEMLEDFIAAYEYLMVHPQCSGKVAVVGFCFGGWIANMMAARQPELAAAVPFYGRQVAGELVPDIEAPLQLHYGELDKRVNEGWPAYEAALKANSKSYEAYIYPNANHGFHNDTTPRYDEEAAELAWSRTIEFFNKYLNQK